MDFMIGGTAAMCAGIFSNPFDVIKTRQQLQGELERSTTNKLPYRGLWQAIKSIIKAEGVVGLQKGLCSALAFQFVMNSTRLGLYETVDTWEWTRAENSPPGSHSTGLCILWGGVAGVAGSAIGCPFYMVKTQIQAQSHGKFAVGFQHGHSGTVSALKRAYTAQGVRGLWKGVEGIVPRTAVGSAIQLSTFTTCKDFFLQYEVRGIYSMMVFFLILIIFWDFLDFPKFGFSDGSGIEYGQRFLSGRRYDTVRCGRHAPI